MAMGGGGGGPAARGGAAFRGVDEAAAPEPLLPEVSSGEVRAALGRGDAGAIAALMPRAVLAQIVARGLYGTSGGQR